MILRTNTELLARASLKDADFVSKELNFDLFFKKEQLADKQRPEQQQKSSTCDSGVSETSKLIPEASESLLLNSEEDTDDENNNYMPCLSLSCSSNLVTTASSLCPVKFKFWRYIC